MAKKQQRYYQSDLEKALPQLLGGNINLVLQDGQVHYLKLIRLEDKQVVATDGLKRIHRFPLHTVAEVIAEQPA